MAEHEKNKTKKTINLIEILWHRNSVIQFAAGFPLSLLCSLSSLFFHFSCQSKMTEVSSFVTSEPEQPNNNNNGSKNNNNNKIRLFKVDAHKVTQYIRFEWIYMWVCSKILSFSIQQRNSFYCFVYIRAHTI